MFITLSQSVEERLARLARRRGLSTSEYARKAIVDHIEDQEDVYEAKRILRRVRAGKEAIYSLDEARKRLDSKH
jgi:predicted DNA-binding protein